MFVHLACSRNFESAVALRDAEEVSVSGCSATEERVRDETRTARLAFAFAGHSRYEY